MNEETEVVPENVPEKPLARALKALRDAIIEASAEERFADVAELSRMAQTVRTMGLSTVHGIRPNPHALPVFLGAGPHHVPEGPLVAGPPAGGLGDNDMGTMLRELMMNVASMNEQAKKKDDANQRRYARSAMIDELESLNRIRADGAEDPRIAKRIEALLSMVEGDADETVSTELLRGHSSDGAGLANGGPVGEVDPIGVGSDDGPGQEVRSPD